MLGIAARFGVTLEALQTANPQVDPRFLPVGAVLVIPLDGEGPTGLPTPTPVALSYAAPQCYRPAEGGLWCFLPVRNGLSQDVENVVALMTLYSGGEALASLEAAGLLNRLPAGREIPLVAYFPPPVPAAYSVGAQLLTALAIAPEDGRYLSTTVQVGETELALEGKQAIVRGRVALAAESGPASVVWVVAVAYNAEGAVVGARRWESATGLEAGSSLPFEVSLFSLGGAIERVEVLVEARP